MQQQQQQQKKKKKKKKKERRGKFEHAKRGRHFHGIQKGTMYVSIR